MDPAPANLGQAVKVLGRFVKRLMAIGQNRLELFLVEVEETRLCFLRVIVLTLAVTASGFLALLALNIAIVIWLWKFSPVLVLLVLAAGYGLLTGFLYWRLTCLLRDWKILSATLDQLQKDRECLEKEMIP